MKKIALAFAMGIIAFSAPISLAHGDESANPSHTPSLYSDEHAGQQPGDRSKPDGREHEVREERHGLELLPISIVAGSLIIAIGLAVGISRRPH